ncbi:MAG TPA: hypothetical protein VH540_02725 [Ktedonobacterales bacterium]
MERDEVSTRRYMQKVPGKRVQIGVRMEMRMVKVLKALAEYDDMSLGELLEGVVLHVFERKLPFSEETLKVVAQFKAAYGMDYDASASHQFQEPARDSDE